MADAFPLDWPQGWPVTPEHQREQGRYKYKTSRGPLTMARAQQGFYEEMERWRD